MIGCAACTREPHARASAEESPASALARLAWEKARPPNPGYLARAPAKPDTRTCVRV